MAVLKGKLKYAHVGVWCPSQKGEQCILPVITVTDKRFHASALQHLKAKYLSNGGPQSNSCQLGGS